MNIFKIIGKLTLEEAVKKGLAVPKQEKFQSEINEGFQFLHIKGIINPITRQEMPLNEAISSGFLDYTECEFHDDNNNTRPTNNLDSLKRADLRLPHIYYMYLI